MMKRFKEIPFRLFQFRSRELHSLKYSGVTKLRAYIRFKSTRFLAGVSSGFQVRLEKLYPKARDAK